MDQTLSKFLQNERAAVSIDWITLSVLTIFLAVVVVVTMQQGTVALVEQALDPSVHAALAESSAIGAVEMGPNQSGNPVPPVPPPD